MWCVRFCVVASVKSGFFSFVRLLFACVCVCVGNRGISARRSVETNSIYWWMNSVRWCRWQIGKWINRPCWNQRLLISNSTMVCRHIVSANAENLRKYLSPFFSIFSHLHRCNRNSSAIACTRNSRRLETVVSLKRRIFAFDSGSARWFHHCVLNDWANLLRIGEYYIIIRTFTGKFKFLFLVLR